MATKSNPKSSQVVKNLKPISTHSSDMSNSPTDGDKKLTKKIPPIKAPVGLVKGPDLKNCKSKVGSFHNIKHTPSGGKATIPSQKLKWEAKSKVGSLENTEHKPGGGAVKVETRKLEWKTSSKVQSLQNIDHKPGGGKVKIFNDSYADDLVRKKLPTATADNTAAKQPDSKLSSESSSKKSPDAITKDFKNMKF